MVITFNTVPWNYTGTENVVSIPDPSITDWVLLAFRDATSPGGATSATTVGRMAAFVRSDGQIVDINNNPLIDFRFPYYHNLYLVVYQANHLGIISNNGLIPAGGAYTYDFSTGSGQAFGGVNAQKELAPGVWGMFSGDGDRNGSVGTSDKNSVWTTNAGNTGYNYSDYNLDSQTNNIDKNDYWVPNIGKGTQVPN